MNDAAPPRNTELERILTRELLRSCRTVNANYFRGSLKPAVLMLVDAKSFWARWLEGTRTIEVSRALVYDHPWTVVVEVLKHEMTHQFVREILAVEETAHGPAFRSMCKQLGIDAQSAGLPTAQPLDTASERVLSRVQKLLALAQSDNQHEAESAAAAAQKLMLKHNLSEAETRGPGHYGFRQIGRITGRTQDWERRLGGLLSKHFFVDVIWVPAVRTQDGLRGTVLEAIGSQANLAMAEYVHAFVSRAAEQMWQAHRRTHNIRGNLDRRAFLSGVIAGFSDKLRAQQESLQAEGLVWVPDACRDQYYQKRHPYTRSIRRQGRANAEVFAHGKEAGRSLVLRQGVGEGPSGQVRQLRG